MRKNMVEIEESLHFDRCPDEFSWKSRSTTMPCSLRVGVVKMVADNVSDTDDEKRKILHIG